MASDFHLRYPVDGPYTATWNPDLDPLVQGSEIRRYSGIDAERLTDPSVQYAYRLSDPFFEYVYLLKVSHADQVLFDAFEDVVGGAEFEFKDAEMSDYGLARFAEETLKQRAYQRGESTLSRNFKIVLLVTALPTGS